MHDTPAHTAYASAQSYRWYAQKFGRQSIQHVNDVGHALQDLVLVLQPAASIHGSIPSNIASPVMLLAFLGRVIGPVRCVNTEVSRGLVTASIMQL